MTPVRGTERNAAPELLEAELLSATRQWVTTHGLGPVELRLESLAAADAGAASAGLEDRLFNGSLASLGAAPSRTHEPVLRLEGTPAVAGRRRSAVRIWSARLAASVLLVVGAAAIWSQVQPSSHGHAGATAPPTDSSLATLDRGMKDLLQAIDAASQSNQTTEQFDASQVTDLLDPESLS